MRGWMCESRGVLDLLSLSWGWFRGGDEEHELPDGGGHRGEVGSGQRVVASVEGKKVFAHRPAGRMEPVEQGVNIDVGEQGFGFR